LLKIGRPRSTKGLAVFCAKLADDKLARDIILMNLTKIETAPSDYFVICTCDSEIQVEAVVSSIDRKCRELGLNPPRIEGLDSRQWVLLDFFDVVMHVMIKDSRYYYKLEKLWGDAQFMDLNENGEPRSIKFDEIQKFYKESILD
jgi:ribosome-associated protein